jgi:alpha-amylase/alpha-mannosidase (GH57 family)
MHQPDYRDPATGEFRLPWTYLHALKDYSDMAAHVEAHPAARVTFNFVPVLLDQLEDYERQFRTREMRDPILAALAMPDLSGLAADCRSRLLDYCLRSNHATMVEPFAPFRRLRDIAAIAQQAGDAGRRYLSGQFFADLVTWFHLAWTGETVRRASPLIQTLMEKGESFSASDRRALFDLVGDVVSGIIPRYRALADAGRIELSTTPYNHPMAPLMLDFRAMREAIPDAALPASSAYPGGAVRVADHVRRARESHQRRFGVPAVGMWPAEGGVSERLLAVLANQGVRWTASGEGVLVHSIGARAAPLPPRQEYLYRPYRVGSTPGVTCFFRDDRLSDMIGFEFAKWHAPDAAAHFVGALEAIGSAAPGKRAPVVSVILDGENAWEHYPYNGWYFLDELYARLEGHRTVRMTTFAEFLATGPTARVLERLVAGSWVYGNFATWMGDAAKNRAWDLLCEAKRTFDAVEADLTDKTRAAALVQLADVEGSDWFWWPGDYNPAQSVSAFDALYREKLARLYATLGVSAPAALDEPISRGGTGAEGGGTMRRGAVTSGV